MRATIIRHGVLIRGAFGVAVFAVLSVVLQFAVLPVARALASGPQARDLRAQRIIHHAARFYLAVLSVLGIFELRAHGVERLRREGPHLVVANHPSMFDIVCLTALMPQADCIVGSVRTENFLLSGLIRAAGHVPDDDPAFIVSECAARLRDGRSLVVFPEGTRSPKNGLGPFRRAAARVALETGRDLVPVIIHYDPRVLFKGWRLSDLPDRAIHATVRVLEPIPSKEEGDSERSPAAAARKLSAELREFFLEGLDIGDVGSA